MVRQGRRSRWCGAWGTWPAVAVLTLLVGCGNGGTASGGLGVGGASSPQSSGASSGTASAASPSPAPSATTGTSSPTTTGAAVAAPVDVSSWTTSHFVSPSGRITCAISSKEAFCNLPFTRPGHGVPDTSYCGGHIGVNYIRVNTRLEWMCSGGLMVLPGTVHGQTQWFPATGWPPGPMGSYGFADEPSAAVPYGQGLVAGDLLCRSERVGMRCGNTRTGVAFLVNGSGLEFTGEPPSSVPDGGG